MTRSVRLLALMSIFYANTYAQLPQKTTLPNGWSVSPAGRSIPLGDLPLNIAVSASRKLLAVTNNGQSVQSLQLIDPVSEKLLHTVTIPKAWYGLKFSADEKNSMPLEGTTTGSWNMPSSTGSWCCGTASSLEKNGRTKLVPRESISMMPHKPCTW